MTLHGGQRRLLILAVEDLHWIDKTSEEVLLHLADSIPAARVLLLVTYRPGYQNPFGERTYTTRIGLRTLSDHDSLRLAAGMLAMAEFPPELRDLIVRKAEGNPFFLEEMLKSLLEMGALRRRDGRYVLTKPMSEIYVPDTAQDVIMARIDRLEEVPKRALQLASVIGREFTVRLLERISDVKTQLERFLQELKVLEFIYERRFYPELAYMFKHALTHDVAYNSLLMQRRKELHRLVAIALEEAEALYQIGFGFLRTHEFEKALEFSHQAQALALESGNQNILAASLFVIAFVHAVTGKLDEATHGLEEALRVSRVAGETGREGFNLNLLGQLYNWKGEYEQALQLLEQGFTIGHAHDLQLIVIHILWHRGL